jgi:hypothetical protein
MNPQGGETKANKACSKAYATYCILERILADVAQCNSEIMAEHISGLLRNYSLVPNLSFRSVILQEKNVKSHFFVQKCLIF